MLKYYRKGMRTLSTMTCWNDFSLHVSFYVCDAIRGWNTNRKSSRRKRLTALYVSFLAWDFLYACAKYNKAKGDEWEDDELAYYDISDGDYRWSVAECDEIFRLLFFRVLGLNRRDWFYIINFHKIFFRFFLNPNLIM